MLCSFKTGERSRSILDLLFSKTLGASQFLWTHGRVFVCIIPQMWTDRMDKIVQKLLMGWIQLRSTSCTQQLTGHGHCCPPLVKTLWTWKKYMYIHALNTLSDIVGCTSKDFSHFNSIFVGFFHHISTLSWEHPYQYFQTVYTQIRGSNGRALAVCNLQGMC